MSTEDNREASQTFEWQGRSWHLPTFYWKSQKRYKCPHCEFDHYTSTAVLEHLASEHLHTVHHRGQHFDLLVFYRKGAKIYQCFDCAFESQEAEVVADHSGTRHRRLLPPPGESVIEAMAEVAKNASAIPDSDKHPRLSAQDLAVHETVGKTNFETLTNAEILKTSTLKNRLLHERHLKTMAAAKSAFNRIRRAKGYPFSRPIKKKRSIQP